MDIMVGWYKMKLYLSSYKLGNKTEYLKEWIKDNNNRVLLIINARDTKEQNDEEKEIINQNVKMLEDIGFKVTTLDLRDYFNKKDELKKYILENFSAICVIGGNVFVLRKAMELSGFDTFLRENRKNGNLLYIGYSAGICVLSKNLEGLDLVDEKINIYNYEEVKLAGVGIINYSIAPHYKSNHSESKYIDDLVTFFKENKVKYKALRDGDVIISSIK